jgi:hypothetical protein
MKLSTPNKNRTLHATYSTEDSGFFIVERIRDEYGFGRGRWDTQRLILTDAELDRLYTEREKIKAADPYQQRKAQP